MFTVLSNTRNSNLYLMAVLAIVIVVLATSVIPPVISASQRPVVSMNVNSEPISDYFQRHPELKASVTIVSDATSDFALRHPQWLSAPVPVTSNSASDYFQRHPLQNRSIESAADQTDYSIRHAELRTPNTTLDLSDYFQRH